MINDIVGFLRCLQIYDFCDGVLEFQNMNYVKRLVFKRGFILVCCVFESSVTMLVNELFYLV